MRRRSALTIAVIVGTIILASTVPAHAHVKLREYRGHASQRGRIWFSVARTEEGRFVKRLSLEGTLTCEDATTRDWAGGWRARRVPITDGVFSFDDVAQYTAAHFEGTLRTLSGEGTVSLAIPVLTPDEQAQLCTTGDLTWEVEYVRTS
jgi:hypothetical protein